MTSVKCRVASEEGREKAMKRKIIVLILCVMLSALSFLGAVFLALGFPAEAQQAKIPRIGYVAPLSPAAESSRIDAFKHGLQNLGYVEGKNIQVEFRYAEGNPNRIPALVGELVHLRVDVIVAEGLTTTRAAKEATKTIPIVMVTANDPVAEGIVDSLSRPGGNITGLTRLTRHLSGKRLELLKDVVPAMSRVGVLWDADNAAALSGFKEYEAASLTLKTKLSIPGGTRAYPRSGGRISSRSQKPRSRSDRYPQSINPTLLKADCRPCHKESTPFNVRRNQFRRSRGTAVLFIQRH